METTDTTTQVAAKPPFYVLHEDEKTKFYYNNSLPLHGVALQPVFVYHWRVDNEEVQRHIWTAYHQGRHTGRDHGKTEKAMELVKALGINKNTILELLK
jgi:hypothetical protein